MDDVSVVIGEPLDRRPFEPVPDKIQQSDGNSCINMFGVGDRRGGQAILPGTGEHRQRIARVQSGGE